MPYITQENRDKLQPAINEVLSVIESKGDRAYVIFQIMCGTTDLSYDSLSGMIGDVECVKRELQRTIVDRYEERKLVENGAILDHATELYLDDKSEREEPQQPAPKKVRKRKTTKKTK